MKFESVLVLTAFFFLSKQINAVPVVGQHKSTFAGMESPIAEQVNPIGENIASGFSHLFVGSVVDAAKGTAEGAATGAGYDPQSQQGQQDQQQQSQGQQQGQYRQQAEVLNQID